ncbi:MAG: hypothetical protein AAGC72_03850 [Planctomycetota bacterium]
MSSLVHKSVYIEPEVWQRLKINAELSDLTLRDYLRQLIMSSEPVVEAGSGSTISGDGKSD